MGIGVGAAIKVAYPVPLGQLVISLARLTARRRKRATKLPTRASATRTAAKPSRINVLCDEAGGGIHAPDPVQRSNILHRHRFDLRTQFQDPLVCRSKLWPWWQARPIRIARPREVCPVGSHRGCQRAILRRPSEGNLVEMLKDVGHLHPVARACAEVFVTPLRKAEREKTRREKFCASLSVHRGKPRSTYPTGSACPFEGRGSGPRLGSGCTRLGCGQRN